MEITDDFFDEDLEEFSLALQNPGFGILNPGLDEATVFITDNDGKELQ